MDHLFPNLLTINTTTHILPSLALPPNLIVICISHRPTCHSFENLQYTTGLTLFLRGAVLYFYLDLSPYRVRNHVRSYVTVTSLLGKCIDNFFTLPILSTSPLFPSSFVGLRQASRRDGKNLRVVDTSYPH